MACVCLSRRNWQRQRTTHARVPTGKRVAVVVPILPVPGRACRSLRCAPLPDKVVGAGEALTACRDNQHEKIFKIVLAQFCSVSATTGPRYRLPNTHTANRAPPCANKIGKSSTVQGWQCARPRDHSTRSKEDTAAEDQVQHERVGSSKSFCAQREHACS